MTTLLDASISKFKALGRLVGNTPLLSIQFRYCGRDRSLYAKAEYLSLTGSIKDRMALSILQKAYAEGTIEPGYTIAEATSGNTGIAFAAIGRMLGHPVKIFMPDWMSQERVQLIKSYGAEIVSVSKDAGGFLGSIQMCEDFAASNKNVFLPRQFSNPANITAHAETTGPEIWSQMMSVGKRPRAFVSGVGTGGTVMGVAKFLRHRDPSIRIHPVEPAESPTLSTGCKVHFEFFKRKKSMQWGDLEEMLGWLNIIGREHRLRELKEDVRKAMKITMDGKGAPEEKIPMMEFLGKMEKKLDGLVASGKRGGGESEE